MRSKLLVYYALALSLVVGGLSSCDRDPVIPTDETKNKLHEDPTRLVLTLEEGLLDVVKFDQNPRVTDVQIVSRQVLEMSSVGGHSFGVTEQSPAKQLVVRTIAQEPRRVYVLRVQYFSPTNAPMNHQFIQNGQDKIHQHFFTTYRSSKTNPEEKSLVRRRQDLAYDYRYADTEPHDDDRGSAIGQSNPLGFKGIFRFLRVPEVVDMRMELLHASQSKFLGANGVASPFYAPSSAQRQIDQWDINIKLPIVIQD